MVTKSKEVYEYFFGDHTENKYARNILFILLTKMRQIIYPIRYDSPTVPPQLLEINPDLIETHNRKVPIERGLGQIISDDWDMYTEDLDTHPTPIGLREHFVEGKNWEDTPYYERAKKKIENGKSHWGYTDLDHFRNERCDYVDTLYKRINKKGYRRTTPENHDVPDTDHRTDVKRYEQAREPLVAITRDGRIALRDGYHRVILAQILEIDTIPVHILARHSRWQSYREQAYQSNTKSELSEDIKQHIPHPDVPFTEG